MSTTLNDKGRARTHQTRLCRTVSVAETSARSDGWANILRPSKYLCRNIRCGILSRAAEPFRYEEIPSAAPPKKEYKLFAQVNLHDSIHEANSKKITGNYAMRHVQAKRLMLSAFFLRQEEVRQRKERFSLHFQKQSQNWPKSILEMESLPSFALEPKINE